MQRHRGNATDRAGLALHEQLTTRRRKGVLRTVNIQEHQTARRAAQVMHARHRLLALVAALIEMHSGTGVIQLLRDGLIVSLGAVARAPRLNTQSLRSPQTGKTRIRRFSQGGQNRARHNAQETLVVRTRVVIARLIVTVATRCRSVPGILPHQRPGLSERRMHRTVLLDRVAGGLQHGVFVAEVLHLNAHHEFHAVQVIGQGLSLVAFHNQPECLAVLDSGGCVLHSALRGKQQELAALPGGHAGQNLRGDGGQPILAVRPLNTHHAQGGAVHQHQRLACFCGAVKAEGALLQHGVAVVCGDAGIQPGGGKSAVQAQQGAHRAGGIGLGYLSLRGFNRRFSHGRCTFHAKSLPRHSAGQTQVSY